MSLFYPHTILLGCKILAKKISLQNVEDNIPLSFQNWVILLIQSSLPSLEALKIFIFSALIFHHHLLVTGLFSNLGVEISTWRFMFFTLNKFSRISFIIFSPSFLFCAPRTGMLNNGISVWFFKSFPFFSSFLSLYLLCLQYSPELLWDFLFQWSDF